MTSLPNLHKYNKRTSVDEISKLVSAQDEIIKHLSEQNDYLKKYTKKFNKNKITESKNHYNNKESD